MRKGFKYLGPVIVTGLIILCSSCQQHTPCNASRCPCASTNAICADYTVYDDFLDFLIPGLKK